MQMIKTIGPFILSFLIVFIVVAGTICKIKDDKRIDARLTVIEKKLGIVPQ